MVERRTLALGAAALVVATVPVTLALTDRHLAGASAALVLSTTAGTLAVSALALQPLLARRRRIARHQVLGAVVLTLVLVHVGALFAESSADAWFALSPDGPTRARMALIATLALFGVVALGIAHAVLTDGALDGAGTAVLVLLGAIGLLGVPAAHVTRTRRARSADR